MFRRWSHAEAQPVPVRNDAKLYELARSQVTTRVRKGRHPAQSTPAVIEPLQISSERNLDLNPAWQHAIAAWTLCAWLRDDNSASVYLANKADHVMDLPRGTVFTSLMWYVPIRPDLGWWGQTRIRRDSVQSRASTSPRLRFPNLTLTEHQQQKVLIDVYAKFR